jgi:RNA polymerase sigma-70 factor (ECF subfamily)
MTEPSDEVANNDDSLYESLLVLRVQTGDERAFVELVERYHVPLRRFLGEMLHDAHATDDVLQTVWLDVFRGVGKLRDLNAFPAWLYRIARNHAYSLLRRRGGVRATQGDEEELAEVTDGAEEPGAGAADEELVHASMERLPHFQREVLLMRFVGGMNYEQIAAAVGCERGTVASRIFYAKRALRRELERKGLP